MEASERAELDEHAVEAMAGNVVDPIDQLGQLEFGGLTFNWIPLRLTLLDTDAVVVCLRLGLGCDGQPGLVALCGELVDRA